MKFSYQGLFDVVGMAVFIAACAVILLILARVAWGVICSF